MKKFFVKRATLDKLCDFVCELKPSGHVKDENAIIREITTNSFTVETKYDIPEEHIDCVSVSFFDGKMVPIALTSTSVKKTVDMELKKVSYYCEMKENNTYVERCLIIHSPKRGEKRDKCQTE